MDDLDIFEITGTLSKSPTHCADHLINPLFRSSGRFPDHLDTFQIIRTLFRSSGRFSDHLVTFQIIWTLFRSSGHFSDHLETFQTTGIVETFHTSQTHFCQCLKRARGRKYSTINVSKFLPASNCSRRLSRIQIIH